MMNRRLLLAGLVVLAAILAVGVVAETAARYDGDDTPGDELSAQSELPAGLTEGPANPAEVNVSALSAKILARPLFAADRRPPPSAAGPSGTPRVASTSLPRLTGIVIDKGVRVAIFQSKDSDRPLVVAEGGKIGNAKVASIMPLEVIVSGPTGEWHLHPMPDPGLEPSPISIPISHRTAGPGAGNRARSRLPTRLPDGRQH